jgi:ferredoxin
MRINKEIIRRFLQKNIRKDCLIGICDPVWLQGLKPVYSLKNKKWSTGPKEIFPETQAVIVLIKFSPIANDYSVEKVIVRLGAALWKKVSFKTHIIDGFGHADSSRLVGTEWGPSAKRCRKLILLKQAAYYAGLGQYGKNSLIINPAFGSDFKIQVLMTDEELEYDKPMVPKRYPECRGCRVCIELCPGAALSNYKIDPRKCCVQSPEHLIWERIPRRQLINLSSRMKPKKGFIVDKRCCRNCQSFCKVNSKHYTEKVF